MTIAEMLAKDRYEKKWPKAQGSLVWETAPEREKMIAEMANILEALERLSAARVQERASDILEGIHAEGYRIVPVVPTAAWIQATYENLDNYTRRDIDHVLTAALALAPKVK